MLRVGFFGQHGPFAPAALRELLAARSPLWQLSLVVNGLRRGTSKEPSRVLPPLRADAAAPHGGGHADTPPATSVHEGDQRALVDPMDLAGLALRHDLPVLQTPNVNSRAAVDMVRGFGLDLLVTVGFDRIFKPDLLAAARLGGLNAHPSPLPRWRGPAPLFWSLRAGEETGHVSVHRMEAQVDHGEVFAHADFDMCINDSGAQLYGKAGTVAGQLMAQVLDKAAVGALEGWKQDERVACGAPMPRHEDALVVPSHWRCRHLVQFINGASIFRLPWLVLGDRVVYVNRAQVAEEVAHPAAARYVLDGASAVRVGCSDGVAQLSLV